MVMTNVRYPRASASPKMTPRCAQDMAFVVLPRCVCVRQVMASHHALNRSVLGTPAVTARFVTTAMALAHHLVIAHAVKGTEVQGAWHQYAMDCMDPMHVITENVSLLITVHA